MATIFNNVADLHEKAQQFLDMSDTETVRAAVAEITAVVNTTAKHRGECVTVQCWLVDKPSRGQPVDYEIDVAEGVTMGFVVRSESGDILEHYLETVSTAASP